MQWLVGHGCTVVQRNGKAASVGLRSLLLSQGPSNGAIDLTFGKLDGA